MPGDPERMKYKIHVQQFADDCGDPYAMVRVEGYIRAKQTWLPCDCLFVPVKGCRRAPRLNCRLDTGKDSIHKVAFTGDPAVFWLEMCDFAGYLKIEFGEEVGSEVVSLCGNSF